MELIYLLPILLWNLLMMKCTFKIQFYTDKIQNMDRISSEKYFHSMKCIFLWNNDFKPPRQISYSYRLLKQSLYDSGFIRDHDPLNPLSPSRVLVPSYLLPIRVTFLIRSSRTCHNCQRGSWNQRPTRVGSELLINLSRELLFPSCWAGATCGRHNHVVIGFPFSLLLTRSVNLVFYLLFSLM